MSQSQHAAHLRNGVKMGALDLVDTMIKDGLWDAFNGYHMGTTAENVAAPVADHARRAGQLRGRLAEQGRGRQEGRQVQGRDRCPSPSSRKKGDIVVSEDEYIRDGATLEGIAKLRPAFDKEGTVTAANASGINDGAAAVVLMTLAEAQKRGIEPLARIVSWAHAGVDPSIMGTGPIPASKKALEKAGWTVKDLDLVEANEAFAAQACAVNKGLGWDTDKVNVNGGAIAIGHPIGASGARVLTTLLYEMKRRDAKKGLATLCIGGGMGIAMCVERDVKVLRNQVRLRLGSGMARQARTPLPNKTETRGSREELNGSCRARDRRNAWHRPCHLDRTEGTRLSRRRQLRRQRCRRPAVPGRDRHPRLQVGRRRLCGVREGRGAGREGARPRRRPGQQRRHHAATPCSTA